jgi:hypothetical protein
MVKRKAPMIPRICETCKRAGVSQVMSAEHHGMTFLLSAGPEQVGGIVYRNDEMSNSEIKELAMSVNAELSLKIGREDNHA